MATRNEAPLAPVKTGQAQDGASSRLARGKDGWQDDKEWSRCKEPIEGSVA